MQEQKKDTAPYRQRLTAGLWLAAEAATLLMGTFLVVARIFAFNQPNHTYNWLHSVGLHSFFNLGILETMLLVVLLFFSVVYLLGNVSGSHKKQPIVHMLVLDGFLLAKLFAFLKTEWLMLHAATLYGPVAAMVLVAGHLGLVVAQRVLAAGVAPGGSQPTKQELAPFFMGGLGGLAALFLLAFGVGALVYTPFWNYQVRFEHEGLEAAVRQALELPEGPVYRSDLDTIVFLSVSGTHSAAGTSIPAGNLEQSRGYENSAGRAAAAAQAVTLRDLRHFSNLQGLELYEYCYNLLPATASGQLEYFAGYQGGFWEYTDLVQGALYHMPEMRTLVLEWANLYGELEFVDAMPRLEQLSVRAGRLNAPDFGRFAALPNLRLLDLDVLSNQSIADITPLAGNTTIEEFNLGSWRRTLQDGSAFYLQGAQALTTMEGLFTARLSYIDVNQQDFALLYGLPDDRFTLTQINAPQLGRSTEWDVYLQGYYERAAARAEAGEGDFAIRLVTPADNQAVQTIGAPYYHQRGAEQTLTLPSGAQLSFGDGGRQTLLYQQDADAAFAILGNLLYRIQPSGAFEYIDNLLAYNLSPSGNVLYYVSTSNSGAHVLMRLGASGPPAPAGDAVPMGAPNNSTAALEPLVGLRYSRDEVHMLFTAQGGSHLHTAGEVQSVAVPLTTPARAAFGVSQDGGQIYRSTLEGYEIVEVSTGIVLYSHEREVTSFIMGQGSSCIALLQNAIVFWNGERATELELEDLYYPGISQYIVWNGLPYAAYTGLYGYEPYARSGPDTVAELAFLAAEGYPMDAVYFGTSANQLYYASAHTGVALLGSYTDEAFDISADGARATWIDRDTGVLTQWQAATGETQSFGADVLEFAASADGGILYYAADATPAPESTSQYRCNLYRADADTGSVQTLIRGTDITDTGVTRFLYTTADGESLIYRLIQPDLYYAWQLRLPGGEEAYLSNRIPAFSFDSLHIPESLLFFYEDRLYSDAERGPAQIYFFNGQQRIYLMDYGA